MKTALLMLEIQNDYFPNGRIPLERSLDASIKAQIALQTYRERKEAILHVQHISTEPNATYFFPCTKGADFYPSVHPLKNEPVFKKHYPNSFKDTQLLNYLKKQQIKHLVICGMMTHQTIDSTVRAAFDLGFYCTILQDACAARQLEFNQTLVSTQNVQYAILAALQTQYAVITTVDEHLQIMQRRVLTRETVDAA